MRLPVRAAENQPGRVKQIDERLLSWASVIEEETLAQARRTAALPFVHPHVALMPDAHLGIGATVGSVIPTVDAVVPAAVGVDIGCGMIALRTGFSRAELLARAGMVAAGLRALRQAIERAVPLSAGRYNAELTPSAAARVAELERLAADTAVRPERDAGNWRLQLGSLGSGNHFIEVTRDELDRLWLFLHSGSRGVGNRIAQRHIKVARARAAAAGLPLADPDLAHLSAGTAEFDAYLADLHWAQHFALLNREEMMDRVVGCLADFMDAEVAAAERINCHHNFTQEENHFGARVWVSRKGAIEARAGMPGLIPGSMGTASYVVTGCGNPLSLNSSPHGAGRRYSRRRARRTFTQDDLREAMRGIEFRDTAAFVDEIPAAYKDIDQVMADAADLVSIRHTLRQVVNVKGD